MFANKKLSKFLLSFFLCVVAVNKFNAMTHFASNIVQNLTSRDEISFFSLLQNVDWNNLRSDDAFIIKVLDILQATSPTTQYDECVKNVHIKGWASYILGKLNSEKPLAVQYLLSWAKSLEIEDNCIKKIGVENNHVNVTIYQLGDYLNLNHDYLSKEFGLAFCVSENGKPSFPVFKHTAINESFEFLAGHGYISLFMGDSIEDVKMVTVAKFNELAITEKLEEGLLYLVTVCPSNKLFLPAQINVQFCSFNEDPLKFLIYSYPPFSYIERGLTQSKIEEKPAGFWVPGEPVQINQNPSFKMIAFIKQNCLNEAAQVLEDVNFGQLEECLNLIKNDYETINELFVFFADSIPTEESMHSMAKLKGQWWDFMAAFFGIEESHELTRYKKSKVVFKHFLALDNVKLKKQIIQNFIKHLKFHTFHSSASLRVAPLALAVINMLQGKKNLLDTSILSQYPENELAQSLKNHLYFCIPSLWQGQFNSENIKAYPKPFLANDIDMKKKQIRWLDVATAPKGTGSTALNFLERVFNDLLPDIKFSFYGTDIMFPPFFYNEETRCFCPAFVNIEKDGVDFLNDITFYDGRRPCFNVADRDFDSDDQLGKYDFITMVKAFHHFHHHGSEKRLLPLAEHVKFRQEKKRIQWCNQDGQQITAPLYYIDDSQQLTVENLLSKLNNDGILFIELCFLHLPKYQFINSDNEDSFVIIKRLSDNKFMIYSQIIPFNPQPYECYPYEEFLLYGDDIGKTSRYYYRIGMNFPGFIKAYGMTQLSKSNRSELNQLLKEAHLLVYRHQIRDHSPWCQMRDSAQVAREGKSIKEAMQVYMLHVPECDDKRRILEKIEVIYLSAIENIK